MWPLVDSSFTVRQNKNQYIRESRNSADVREEGTKVDIWAYDGEILHCEEIQDLYFFQINIRVTRSRGKGVRACGTHEGEEQCIMGFGGKM